MTLFLKRCSSNGFLYVQLRHNSKPSSFQRSYFSTFFRGENRVKPSLPQQKTQLNLQGNWISLQGNNVLPHMSFSAHLSFNALAWDLVSSVGLYDSKSKSHRNSFAFRFQVKVLLFALETDVNWDCSFHTLLQKAFSRGHNSAKLSWGQASRPPSFSPPLLQ